MQVCTASRNAVVRMYGDVITSALAVKHLTALTITERLHPSVLAITTHKFYSSGTAG